MSMRDDMKAEQKENGPGESHIYTEENSPN